MFGSKGIGSLMQFDSEAPLRTLVQLTVNFDWKKLAMNAAESRRHMMFFLCWGRQCLSNIDLCH
eukprot:5536457-Amphidinium_carterae.1